IEDRDLFIVQSAPENVGRCMDMRVHKAGNRVYRRWRWRKDADPREQLARVDNGRHAGSADDRHPGFEERAPTRLGAQLLVALGATGVDQSGGLGAAAAVSEFPPREIGPAHGSGSSVAERRGTKIVGRAANSTSQTDYYIICSAVRSTCRRFEANE